MDGLSQNVHPETGFILLVDDSCVNIPVNGLIFMQDGNLVQLECIVMSELEQSLDIITGLSSELLSFIFPDDAFTV